MSESMTSVLRELFMEMRKVIPEPNGNIPRFENMGQTSVMMYLIDNDGTMITQKDIEIHTHRSKATVSGILDTLEKRHLIVRKPSSYDRRKKIVCITEEMRVNIEPVKRQFKEIECLLIRDIAQEDLDAFYRVVFQMIGNIQRG